MSQLVPHEITTSIRNDWPIDTKKSYSEEQLADALSPLIADKILHDFSGLIYLLYRIDINEHKLKKLLQEHKDADAARIIAHLIIERQKQKLESRKQYRQDGRDIPEEEKW